jgi:succinate dehydrogenase / fumarate reductase membrane anchor subunit
MNAPKQMRTPLSQVRYLGAARAGTEHFWRQRLTAVALVPLTIAAIVIVIMLLGRNQPDAARILGSPLVAVTMLLFILTSIYHMWLGMQVIIEDYVHAELLKIATLMANTFFSIVLALASVYAILVLSFGV